jgi:integrase
MLTVKEWESKIQAAKAAAKAENKPKTVFDGNGSGLHIKARPSGTEPDISVKTFWQLKYTLNGRSNLTSLGEYPTMSIKMARDKCHEAKQKIADGINPAEERRTERDAYSNTFKTLAEEWLKRQTDLLPGTVKRHQWRLERYVYPHIANKPIDQITAPELLAVLRRIEAQKKLDTAKRIRELCSSIWCYAIGEGKAQFDIAHSLKDQIQKAKKKSHAAITDPKKLGGLLWAIDGYEDTARNSFLTAGALKLAPMLFVRPGELRRMEWSELNLEEATWRIPADKMKMRDPHLVPLAKQAVKILESLKVHSGSGRYVFPSLQTEDRPMSENTLNGALRRLGYSHDEHVAHGFRSTASTLLNEMGFDPDVIELQLAHKPRGVRAVYNRAVRLDERRIMMTKWANYLDKLKTST